jgi:hypothetical protein
MLVLFLEWLSSDVDFVFKDAASMNGHNNTNNYKYDAYNKKGR